MILPTENQDLSLLDICPIGAIFLFAFFPLEVLETTIPLDSSVLLNNRCIVLPPQIHLLDCDFSSIQPPLHLSRPSNTLNLLHTSVSYGRILSMPKKKVPMLHDAEFRSPWDGHEHFIHSCINPKSLNFGYLDEKLIDTGLMKFLGLCLSALSWYLEFAFAFSTSLAPFTTNALSLHESKGSMTPRKSGLCGTMVLPSP
ncbi:hypothetical protein BHM03_00017137 [Ensete ventricosum]|uniref:Uncharacterized protein n=1 Tax=Ensete ventricosum TaxID=4639 RepID=A0A445MF22_ENSVE|nr:hypothetical protein BHM03_00017137 [Ensete ventricosum]